MKYLFMILMMSFMAIGCAKPVHTPEPTTALSEEWFGVYVESTNNKRIIIKEGYFRIDEFINGFWTIVDEGYSMEDLQSKYFEIKMVNGDIDVVEDMGGVFVGTTYYWIAD